MSSSLKRFFELTAVAVTGILMPLLWAVCGSPCSLTFFRKGILWISFNWNIIGFKISDLWLKVDGDCEVGAVGCINPSIFFDPWVKSFVSTVAAWTLLGVRNIPQAVPKSNSGSSSRVDVGCFVTSDGRDKTGSWATKLSLVLSMLDLCIGGASTSDDCDIEPLREVQSVTQLKSKNISGLRTEDVSEKLVLADKLCNPSWTHQSLDAWLHFPSFLYSQECCSLFLVQFEWISGLAVPWMNLFPQTYDWKSQRRSSKASQTGNNFCSKVSLWQN